MCANVRGGVRGGGAVRTRGTAAAAQVVAASLMAGAGVANGGSGKAK